MTDDAIGKPYETKIVVNLNMVENLVTKRYATASSVNFSNRVEIVDIISSSKRILTVALIYE